VEVLENVYERQLLALSGEAFVEEVTICGLLPGSPQELRLPDTCLGQPVEAVLTLRNASAKHFRRGCRTVNACRPFSAHLSLDLLLTLPRIHVSCSTASNVCEQGRTACECACAGMRGRACPTCHSLPARATCKLVRMRPSRRASRPARAHSSRALQWP